MYTPGDLNGQTWLLTGSNDGIGLHTAHGLVAMGATLLAHARSADKAQATATALRAAHPQATVIPVWGDLSSQAEVRALGGQVLAQAPKLHGLLHNAGALFSSHALTADGVERQLAVNHLAPFLLTHLLWPRLVGRSMWALAAAGASVALILTPVLRPGLPVLAAGVVALIAAALMGRRT